MEPTTQSGTATFDGQIRVLRRYVSHVIPPLLRRREGVTDIVQWTYVDFQERAARYAGMPERERRGLLCRFAQRIIQRRMRWFRAARRFDPDTVAHAAQERTAATRERPSRIAQRAERVDLARQALALLDEDDRRIVEMRTMSELPFSEIAERVGTTEDAARMRFHRTLARLAQRLSRDARSGSW